MRPGLSRAIPMGILGFLVGMILLYVLRTLQSLQPAMEPELAIILGTAFAAYFFVHGMGAFDPKMNTHAHEPEGGEEAIIQALTVTDAEEEAEEPEEAPGKILGGYMWLASTLMLAVILIIVFFALLPDGPSLRTVHEAESDVMAVGYVQMDLFGETYFVSQLTLLLGFVIFMFISLAAFAGGMGLLLFVLNNGNTIVQDIQHTPLQAEPLEAEAAEPNITRWGIISVAAVIGFALVDVLLGKPITAEFSTFSFFLASASVFTLLLVISGYFIRIVAAQTNWAWLVRAIIIVGGVHVIIGGIGFLVSWFLIAPLSLVTAAITSLMILGLLLLIRNPVGIAFTIISGILIPVFYFVLIGLVVAFAPPLLFIISASNALVVAALILRPKFLTHWIGYGAAWTAKQLRRLPNALQ